MKFYAFIVLLLSVNIYAGNKSDKERSDGKSQRFHPYNAHRHVKTTPTKKLPVSPTIEKLKGQPSASALASLGATKKLSF